MELINSWSGNNTTQDSVGSCNLTWEGTPDYLSGGFKLNASNNKSLNGLIFPNFVLSAGTPFSFSGQMLASHNECFSQISTLYDKKENGIAFRFDFMEGLFSVFTNGIYTGHQHYYFAQSPGDLNWEYPTSFNNWHTWKLSYFGGINWELIINDYNVPLLATYNNFSTFNGTANADPLKMYNNGEFGGDTYVLMKDIQFYK